MEVESSALEEKQDTEELMKDEEVSKQVANKSLKDEGGSTSEKKTEMEVESSALEEKQDTEELMKDEEDSKQVADKSLKDEGGSTPEKKTEVKSSISNEPELGITEYLGKHSGFFGILKQRFSDFIVNEVTSGGEVVYLTDRTIIPVPEVIPDMPDALPPQLTPRVIEQLENLVGIPHPARISLVPQPKKTDDNVETKEGSEVAVETKEGLEAAVETKEGSEAAKEVENASPKRKADQAEVLIDVNNVTKEERTIIHQAVKAKFNSITSFYKEGEDGNKYIVIKRNKSSGNTGIPKRNTWPRSHLYTTFVLYKENIDTLDAINHLSRIMRVKANMFAYAGTKDKRGKTTQLVSVPRVAPERLRQATRHKPMHLGNFKFMPTPQKLGQLRGNKFSIVLREVKEDDDVITSAIEALKTNGFINYFGSQRFGTTAISTHFIGRELLKSNWLKAVNLILAPRDNDTPILNQCRAIWQKTNDAAAALRVLGSERDSYIEGRLLMGLKDQQRNDLVGALGSIPRNIRVLYLHAYQSYIWNQVVSKRIAKYGLTVLPGDIIRRKDSANSKDEELTDEEVPVDDENIENVIDGEKDSEKKEEEKGEKSALDKSNFHFLTEEEAKTTHITDVLLPLPGYRVEFPQNEIKDWYEEFLETDGLSVAALNHRVKCYSLGGSYRRIIIHPSDITSCITYYSDPTKPLLQSDMDKLLSESVEDNLLKEGPHKAVILEVTLPASSYATMALRELLKMDTSSAFQATLNSNKPMANSRPDSRRGFERRGGYRGWDDNRGGYRGRGNRNWQPRGRGQFHGNRNSRGFGGGGGGRGRGEKRPWNGPHNRGGKRGRFSQEF